MSNEQGKCPNCGSTKAKVYQYDETLYIFDLATGEWNKRSWNERSDYLSEALCTECGTDLLHLVPGQTLAEEPVVQQLLTAARQVCDVYDVDPDVQEVGGEPLETAMEALLDACKLGRARPFNHQAGMDTVHNPKSMKQISQGALDALATALGYCVGFITGKHSTTEADRAEVLEFARDAVKQIAQHSGGENTMNESNEVLENTTAYLQLTADNGGICSLSAKEAQAILDELERLSGFERAYRASVRDYATLVKGVDMEFDEQADLIADMLEQLNQTVDALAHWFPHWGDQEGAGSQMMINARTQVAKAEEYLEHYHKHMK